ncbi:MAG: phosphatidylglycerophosphatase A family protein [Moraxellaceae bacterium]
MNKPDLRDPVQLLAFGLGSGLAPKAPGTFGSLAALLLFPLLAYAGLSAYLVFMLIAAVGGIWICGHAAHALGVHDDGRIVWDEFAGQWIALTPLVPVAAGVGLSGNLSTLVGLVAAFALFRLLDVAKPWPIGYLDRKIDGGLGIIADDLLAGALAGLLVFLMLRFVF